MPSNHDPNEKLNTHTQPKTYKLSLKAFLTFPFRLCNPPPAVGKVRSCGVTPLFKVRLEDVLDRKHLPPLGLKDFEEWLLFVEMSPENLYFILWLREYKQRYAQWQAQSAFLQNAAAAAEPAIPSSHANHLHPNSPSHSLSPRPDTQKKRKRRRVQDRDYTPTGNQYSSHLAMFYARAKQTFFTPGAEYELNLTSSLLAPFLDPPPASHPLHASPSTSSSHEHNSQNPSLPTPPQTPPPTPYPPPSLFAEIEQETFRTLEASLRRFVNAQLNNVGNKRVMCGIVAGVIFCLIGLVPVLGSSFSRDAFTSPGHAWSSARLTRLAAFPGLWLGLTVLLASLNGICLGVYVFGDLRQLRKFELARPAISRPLALPGPGEYVGFSSKKGKRDSMMLPMHDVPGRKASLVPEPITDIPRHPLAPVSKSVPPPPPSLPLIPPPAAPGSRVRAHDRNASTRSSTSVFTASSSSSSSTASSSSSYYEHTTRIHISPVYVDEDEDGADLDGLVFYEGLDYRTGYSHGGGLSDDTEGEGGYADGYRFPPIRGLGAQGVVDATSHGSSTNADSAQQRDDTLFFKTAATATFIRPFEPTSYEDEEELRKSCGLPERCQRMGGFDFEGLPPKVVLGGSSAAASRGGGGLKRKEGGLAMGMGMMGKEASASVFKPMSFIPSVAIPKPALELLPAMGLSAGVHRIEQSSSLSASSSSSPRPRVPLRVHIPSNVPSSSLPFPLPSASFPSPPPCSPPPPPALLPSSSSSPHHHQLSAPPSRTGRQSILDLIARMQERCNIPKWRLQTGYLEEPDTPKGRRSLLGERWEEREREARRGVSTRSSRTLMDVDVRVDVDVDVDKDGDGGQAESTRMNEKGGFRRDADAGAEKEKERKAWKRFKLMNAVPAFAVPLTRVLSPVIVRAQWEIVVRSAAWAFVITWAVVGVLLAVPLPR
ncbi:hypothetical protein CPC08DRAFT_702374 [Agrocybe pediades]|nr:hypothetical protein CPC08DRAFT_702374 [Agrocybe pediades]